MARKEHVSLSELLGLVPMEKDAPLGGAAAVGSIDGYPVAAAWTKEGNASVVRLLVRFQRGTLSSTADLFRDRIAESPEILAAMGKHKLSHGDRKAVAVGDDAATLRWQYSFRTPSPESVASLLRAFVTLVSSSARPVGLRCETCGREAADLFVVGGIPTVICAGCRERAGEDDRRRIEEYEAIPSNPAAGTLAGIVTAAVLAALWGGIAYVLRRVFLIGAIGIGVAIGWVVTKAMGRVNTYGRVLTCALTVLSVLGGEYLFMVLAAANEMQTPVDAALARLVASRFLEIEFGGSSGWISLIFGLIGALYSLYKTRRPVQRRKIVPVAAEARALTP